MEFIRKKVKTHFENLTDYEFKDKKIDLFFIIFFKCSCNVQNDKRRTLGNQSVDYAIEIKKDYATPIYLQETHVEFQLLSCCWDVVISGFVDFFFSLRMSPSAEDTHV